MRLSRRSLALGLAGLSLASARLARAQGSDQPAALVGARYFDGLRFVGPATLLIRDGRIAAINPAGLPDGTRSIDLAGRFVIPALTSDHCHVGRTGGGMEMGRQFYTREGVESQLRRYQAFGITTVTSLGLNPPLFHQLRQESRDGRLQGARLLGAGTGIGVDGGLPPAGPMQLTDDQVLRPRDFAEARAAVNTLAESGVDLIKIWLDDAGGTAPQMPAEMVRAVVEASHARDIRVAAHIHDLSQAQIALENGVDILAHGIRDKEVDEATLTRMQDRGVWYIPTLQIDEAEYLYAEDPAVLRNPALRAAVGPALLARFGDAEWRETQMRKADAKKAEVRMNQQNLAKLNKAGISIGFGTDSGATPLRVPGFAEHRELELMVQAGLSAAEALQIATAWAATLLRMDDVGRIEPGARADLVVLSEDPLADIRNMSSIQAVWQDGRAVAGPLVPA
jgi:imidazolonepropionase-like amidohydrolase